MGRNSSTAAASPTRGCAPSAITSRCRPRRDWAARCRAPHGGSSPEREPRRTGVMARLITRLTPFVGILVFLLVWEAGGALFKPPPYLLPGPTEIFHTFVREFARLAFHGWVTLYEMLLGYALAVVIAIPLAIAITSSDRFDRFTMPTLLFFQVVPKVAIAPLFLVWFGVGVLPKVLVAFLISFFPIVIDAAVGLR